jgi:hypothetical protein
LSGDRVLLSTTLVVLPEVECPVEDVPCEVSEGPVLGEGAGT